MAIILVPQPGSTPSSLADWTKSVESLKQYNLSVNQPLDYDFSGNTIKKGTQITIGGSNYYANANTAITGTPSDYVKITSAGVASYVSSLSGVSWNDTYNFYADSSGNAYIFNEAKAVYLGTVVTPRTKFGSIAYARTMSISGSATEEALKLGRASGRASIKASALNANSQYLMIDSSGQFLSLNHYVADNIVMALGGGRTLFSTSADNGVDKVQVAGSIYSSGGINTDGNITQTAGVTSLKATTITSTFDIRQATGSDSWAQGSYLQLTAGTDTSKLINVQLSADGHMDFWQRNQSLVFNRNVRFAREGRFIFGANATDNGIDLIQAGADQDKSFAFGRGRMGSITSDSLYISHYDLFDSTNYGIRHTFTGFLALNAISAASVEIKNAGANVATFSGSAINMYKPVTIAGSVGSVATVSAGNGLTFSRDDYNYLRATTTNGSMGFITNGRSSSTLSEANLLLKADKTSQFFSTLMVGEGANNGIDKLQVAGSISCTTINTGQGATEVHLMNQNLRTTDNVTHNNITANGAILPTKTASGTWTSNTVIPQGTYIVQLISAGTINGWSAVDSEGSAIYYNDGNTNKDRGGVIVSDGVTVSATFGTGSGNSIKYWKY